MYNLHLIRYMREEHVFLCLDPSRCFIPGVWVFSRLGNATCQHSSVEWLQVHWAKCIQCCHNVHMRSGSVICHQRSTEPSFYHHQSLHSIQYYFYTLSCFCAKGEFSIKWYVEVCVRIYVCMCITLQMKENIGVTR